MTIGVKILRWSYNDKDKNFESFEQAINTKSKSLQDVGCKIIDYKFFQNKVAIVWDDMM